MIENASLNIIMTANAAQWAPRIKSREIFRKGTVVELSRLQDGELHSLINLVEHQPAIRKLVTKEFRNTSRSKHYDMLREKCSADMFVCLKNIFAFESLDKILLTEFDELSEELQDHYRYVAALEAVGMRVHRQLILRMLGMRADQVSAVLDGLKGIVDEYDIRPRDGIYGWSTRHLVIARKITDYKFSGTEDLIKLFNDIIDELSPAVTIELQSIRDICDAEFGIGRVADKKARTTLYRRLTKLAPAERIPWHRLIRELLDDPQDLEAPEHAIRNAVDCVGSDAPIDRYRFRLLLKRARYTDGISVEDRLVLVRKAHDVALSNVEKHREDQFSYMTLCDVAVELIQRGGSAYILSEAISQMRTAADIILDPNMNRQLRRYEEMFSRLR